MRNTHYNVATHYRTKQWDTGNSTCVLCSNTEESRSHFFSVILHRRDMASPNLTAAQLGLTTAWDSLIQLLNNLDTSRHKFFLLRYCFQTTVYHVWRERNNIKHGEHPLPRTTLIRIIDKEVRNKLSAIRKEGDYSYDLGLTEWFATRPLA